MSNHYNNINCLTLSKIIFQLRCVWKDGKLIPDYEPKDVFELHFLVKYINFTPDKNKRRVSRVVIHPGFRNEGE